MTRSQIAALLLGTSAVIVAAAIARHVHLLQDQAAQPFGVASVASPAAPAKPATPASPAAAVATSQPAAAPSASAATGAPPAASTQVVAPRATTPSQTMAAVEPIAPESPVARPATNLTPTLPQFDTVRVEPSGDAVVAGHGQSNAQVALLANGSPIAEADSDGAGNFVIIPTPFAPGNYELTLRSRRPGKLPRVSVQVVTVSVPAKGQKNLVVAVAEPGKPTKVLADTAPLPAPPATGASASPAATADEKPSVAFKTAEVERDGFYATGTATPAGEHLRVYLNNTHLADLAAAADDHWSLTVKRGLAPGHYKLRADALDAALAKVVARAEVAFDVPLLVAATGAKPTPPAPAAAEADTPPAPAATASESATPSASASATPPQAALANPPPPARGASSEEPAASSTANDAVVPNVNTATVVHGDSLWRISRKIFGHGIRYTLIYEANASQIRNPNLIYPGQVFVVPLN
jgi:nucleoid-associated protein YgaU